eukprot:GFYU01008494.1.p1 GENE.GFYU01008494.1~~GFYU01008494.1.p1  ORF type:complete len:554 (+),score=142.54 GFYU01008494.1:238-1899(+)
MSTRRSSSVSRRAAKSPPKHRPSARHSRPDVYVKSEYIKPEPMSDDDAAFASPPPQRRGRASARTTRPSSLSRTPTRSPSRGRSKSRDPGSRGRSRTPNPRSAIKSTHPLKDGLFMEHLNEWRQRQEHEREQIVLWRRPVLTIFYSLQMLWHTIVSTTTYLATHRVYGTMLFGLTAFALAIHFLPSEEHLFVRQVEHSVWLAWYWIGLGFLSSCGFGTGLHTFILYLAPYMVDITIYAIECRVLREDDPPGSRPECDSAHAIATLPPVQFFEIISFCFIPAALWGLGTAIGELPPYFLARAARLGKDDMELLQSVQREDTEDMTVMDRVQHFLYHVLQKYGMVAIFLCASIPNPLFDLAGVTCGHFKVPFWKFFSATALGKAVVKMALQSLSIVALFYASSPNSDSYVMMAARWVESVFTFLPFSLTKLVHAQYDKYDLNKTKEEADTDSMVASLWQGFILLMMGSFVLSMVNAAAQHVVKENDEAHIESYIEKETLSRGFKVAKKVQFPTTSTSPSTPVSNKRPQSSFADHANVRRSPRVRAPPARFVEDYY